MHLGFSAQDELSRATSTQNNIHSKQFENKIYLYVFNCPYHYDFSKCVLYAKYILFKTLN